MEKIMNDVKDLKKSLPAMENSFSITALEGMITGKKYEGNFTCKIPNLKTQALIEKHKAMLNGGLQASLDPLTLRLHHRLAYLRYTLTEFPKWWKDADMGYELYDGNIVEELYDRVMKFEADWMEAVWGPEEKAPEEKTPDESNPSA
jgi:hypothetical protein